MTSLLKEIFPIFYNTDYDKRAHAILDIVKEHGKMYDKKERSAAIENMSKHMLNKLVEEFTEESFREADAFWRLISNIFPNKITEEYNPVCLINDKITSLENDDTKKSYKRAKTAQRLSREIFPDQTSKIKNPIRSGNKHV